MRDPQGHQTLIYSIKKDHRIRTLRLAVRSANDIIVRIPAYLPEQYAHAFVRHQEPWILQQINRFNQEKKKIPVGKGKPYVEYKQEARALIEDRVRYYNQFYGYTWKTIHIRNQKSRWGSCSRRGVISFNYRLLFLPPYLCDYVVVHELCHLRELNHSRRFWQLVEQTIPQYKEYRKRLRQEYRIALGS